MMQRKAAACVEQHLCVTRDSSYDHLPLFLTNQHDTRDKDLLQTSEHGLHLDWN